MLDENYVKELLVRANKIVEKNAKMTDIGYLTGPVYNDILNSSDASDCVSYDVFWTVENGIKKAVYTNTLQLFSWIDKNGVIRCMLMKNLKQMFENEIFKYPLTQEEICLKEVYRFAEKIKYLKRNKLMHILDDVVIELTVENLTTNIFKEMEKYDIILGPDCFLKLLEDDLKRFRETLRKKWNDNKVDVAIIDTTDIFTPFKDLTYVGLQKKILGEMKDMLDKPIIDTDKKYVAMIIIDSLKSYSEEVKKIFN